MAFYLFYLTAFVFLLRSGIFHEALISCPRRNIHTTNAVMGEPLKKKKRVDPAIEQNRQRRKIRKIEKEIKRITRFDRQLRPVEELEGDRRLMKEINLRKRENIDISENELDYRATAWKDWSRYQVQVNKTEISNYNCAIKAQKEALEWLYKTSRELYKMAIQPCEYLSSTIENEDNNQLLESSSIRLVGPFYDPPVQNTDNSTIYEAPDGEWCDTTPEIKYEFELDRQFLADPKKKKFAPR